MWFGRVLRSELVLGEVLVIGESLRTELMLLLGSALNVTRRLTIGISLGLSLIFTGIFIVILTRRQIMTMARFCISSLFHI